MKKYFIGLSICVSLGYLMFFHYTDTTHTGIRWNMFTGEVSRDLAPGFHFSAPWVLVTRITNTPLRVCVQSASRAVNCRLIQFMPDQYRALVKTEGFRYYWWDNRLSFNFGYTETYRGEKDLLRGYAYSIQSYPFIKTTVEYE